MTTALALAAQVRSGERSAREVVDEALAAVASGNDEVNAFLTVLGDEARDGGRRRRRGGGGRARSGALGGGAGGLEGQPLHTWGGHDVRFEDPGRLAPALRRDRRGGTAGRRCSRARQDEHGRVRHGELDGELGLRPDPQSAPHRQGPRWQQRRLGGRGGGRLHAARPGLRHRRLHPPAGGSVRGGRHEADLRSCVAVRPRGLRQLSRSDRPLRHDGGGRRAPLRRPGRARSARQHVAAVESRAHAGDGA